MKWDNLKSLRFFFGLLVSLQIFVPATLPAQELQVGGRNILHPASTTFKGGEFDGQTVQYLLVGDSGTKKPLIVFCSGSMPSPQLLKTPDGKFIPIGLPFNFYGYLTDFNFLLLSKPGVPLAAEQENLDPQFNYLDPKTRGFPTAFTERNHAAYYQAAWSAVLNDFLSRRPSEKPSKIVLMGHSQGARVATKLAGSFSGVTHLAYLSADPMGRYWEIIRRETDRPDLQASDLDSIYDVWAEISSGRPP
jgi:pimeloyl-ACP methyl ester carboxylesterase